MASTLTLTGCRVDAQSITISFSEPVDVTADATSALNGANYTLFAPNSGFNQASLSEWTPTAMPDGRSVVFEAPSPYSNSNPAFAPGEWVQVTIATSASIGLKSSPGTAVPISGSISGRVPNIPARQVRDVEDAISYPVLTEEIAYRPSSPVGVSTTGAGGIGGPGAFNLGQAAVQAVTDVLGWKINPADPKGFIGALTQSFDLTEVEGHVESKWVPRTYAVQTDLGGGITGAQASLYMRAKDALDQSLKLLDGLYPLDPDADPEYVRALREMARSQMTEIVKEFGVVGLPSVLRINTYFQILLGQDISHEPATVVQLNPDEIAGTLGQIRDTYGIYFDGNPWNNTVADEQDITNFRVISDYMTSLMQSWIANRQFFVVSPRLPAFFGTQLVLISRQFNVIAEAVNEVRFALDSVFIGPNERQMLLLKFAGRTYPSMYLEDVLEEVDSFVANEGPRLLRDGGKISVTNNILPVVRELRDMIRQTRDQRDRDVPRGFKTARVRRSMDDLYGQLDALIKLTEQVEQQLPIPEYALGISGISTPTNISPIGPIPPGGPSDPLGPWSFSIYGSAFDPAIDVFVYSLVTEGVECELENFWSAERVDVTVTLPDAFTVSSHDIVVTNPDGEKATSVGALLWDGTNLTAAAPNGGNGNSGGFGNGYGNGDGGSSYAAPPTVAARRVGRSRRVVTTVDGSDLLDTSSSAGGTTSPSAPSAQSAATAASDQKLKAVTGNAEQINLPAPKTEATAITTKEQIAETLKKHQPSLWERVKDEFEK